MAFDMVCNYKKCRRSLSTRAWVTNCSHAFCDEHGELEFARGGGGHRDSPKCPACGARLPGNYDVVRADLNPPEAFKSIVLAGMKPDLVVDIVMRAISFWSYQTSEEIRYQRNVSKHALDHVKALEDAQSLTLQKMDTDAKTNAAKIETLRGECDKYKRHAEECVARVEEKNRKIQKLQHQLDCHKRNSFHINDVDEKENDSNHKNVMDLLVRRREPSSSNFVFQPNVIKSSKRAKSSGNRQSTPNSVHSGRFAFISPILSKE